jgi:hypothetical protein
MLASNQCQTNAQNPFVKLFDSLNRSREETTSSFFLKKISNLEKHVSGLCSLRIHPFLLNAFQIFHSFFTQNLRQFEANGRKKITQFSRQSTTFWH